MVLELITNRGWKIFLKFIKNSQDSTLNIYKLDISDNTSSPEIYHSIEGFIGGSIFPYSDHKANKFIITGALVSESNGGMFSFDIIVLNLIFCTIGTIPTYIQLYIFMTAQNIMFGFVD